MSTVKWVAGGYSFGGAYGYIVYSYDGINWTKANTGTMFSFIYSVTHSGTVWVVGGGNNFTGYSYDGITWSISTNSPTVFASGQVVGVGYGNGMFVAVGKSPNYTIAYSYDGITWTGCANGSFFNGGYGDYVTYKNSTWVAGSAASGGVIGYSTNGINWTAVTTSLTQGITGIDWNGTYWVAVGTNNANNLYIAYSTNLTSWSTGTTGGSFVTLGRFVRWNGSKFIAVGQSNSGGVQFKTSTNGINWTSSTPANCTTIDYGSNLWVIGKEGTYPLIYSTDGVTWTNSPSTFLGASGIRSVTYALQPTDILGNSPVITSVTTGYLSLKINFTPSTGGTPAPTTYYYTLNGGSTYINANTTTSPISITGIQIATTYNVGILANSLAGNTVSSNNIVILLPLF